MKEAPGLGEATTNTLIPPEGMLGQLARIVEWTNRALLRLSILALLLAAGVLTSSVVTRHLFKAATDWQDEVSIFALVGATFLCSAHVQSRRGHIGIEAVAGLLPAGLNRLRLLFIDLFSLLFCAFFAWKSWALFYEAFVEHQTTASAWGPPLSIPYALMAGGMTLLVIQLSLQFLFAALRPAASR